MVLSQSIKDSIIREHNEWVKVQYGNRTFEERQEMGQFFTPPELTIQLIEKFDNLDGTILDPTCGSGSLLVGCILSGADPQKVYGIELDKDILGICHKRLEKFGVPKEHIHLGNALNDDCYDHFDNSYHYDEKTDTVIINGRRPFRFGV